MGQSRYGLGTIQNVQHLDAIFEIVRDNYETLTVGDKEYKVQVGRGCTIGHGAIIHGCTIGDNSLIGMGAIILNGAKIGNNSIKVQGWLS